MLHFILYQIFSSVIFVSVHVQLFELEEKSVFLNIYLKGKSILFVCCKFRYGLHVELQTKQE